MAERSTVFESLFKGTRDIVHIRAGTEEHALFEPNALAANPVAVRATGFIVVQPVRSVRQKWAESFVAEYWLPVQGEAVTSRAWDALGLQGSEHRGARCAECLSVQAHHEQVVTVTRASGRTCLWMNARQPGEPRREVLAIAISSFGLQLQSIELRIEQCSLEFAQSVIPGDHVVLVPNPARNASAVMNGTAGLSQRIVVGRDDAAFAGGEVFARLKGERCHVSERTGGTLVITCAVRVRGVFDNDQFALFRDRHDRIHVGRLPGEMNGNDRPGSRLDGGLDGFWIQIKGVQVNVGKDRNRVGFNHS